MSNRSSVPVALLIALASVIAVGGPGGCAAGGSSQSIRAAYSDRLAKLQTGMDLSTFKQVLPEARHYDTFFVDSQRFDTYRLDHRFKPDEFPAETQTLYFFFTNQRLDHWGAASW